MHLNRRSFLGLALGLPVLAACDGDDDEDPPGPGEPSVAGAWSVAAGLPTPRSEVASAVLDGKIYIVAGFDARGNSTAVVEAYDPTSDTWERRSPIPGARDHAIAVAHEGRLYVFGGGAGQARRESYLYDHRTDSWAPLPLMPLSRTAGGAATLGGTIVIAGGVGEDPEASLTFDTATGRWERGPLLSEPREHLAVMGDGATVYVVGGRWQNELKATNEALSSLTAGWRTLPDLPTPRGGTSGAVLDGKVYVAGGEAFGPTRTFAEVEFFDPATGRWSRAPDLPTPRHGLAAQAAGGRLYVIGGGPTAGLSVSPQNEVFEPAD
jgi:N-acetylneuraminic acid mutarotase